MRYHVKLKQFTQKLLNFRLLSELTLEDFQQAKAFKKKQDDKLAEGKKLFDQQKFQESLRLVNETIQLNPQRGNAYLLRGEIQLKLKNETDALKNFNHSLALSPTVEGLTARSKLYLTLNQKQEMKRDLQAALELKQKFHILEKEKKNARVFRGLIEARVIFNLSELQARPGFRFSPTFNPNRIPEAIYFQLLGGQYYEKKNLKAAIKCYDRALEINAHDTVVLLARALAYHELMDYKASEGDFTRVIELRTSGPGLPVAYLSRGNIHANFNRFAEAKKDFLNYMLLDPAGKELRALSSSKEIMHEQFFNILKTIESSSPNNILTNLKGTHTEQYAEAKRSMQRNQLDSALNILTYLIIKNPSDGIFYLTRGHAYQMCHHDETALSDFTTAIWLFKSGFDKTPKNLLLPKEFFIARRDLLLNMGSIDESIKDHDEALKEYFKENTFCTIYSTEKEIQSLQSINKREQTLNSQFDEKIIAKTKEAISAENFEEAIHLTTTILKERKTNPAFYVLRGTAYRHLRKKNAAREDFLSALKLAPDDSKIKLKLDNLAKPSLPLIAQPLPLAREKKTKQEDRKSFHMYAPTRKKSSQSTCHPRESGDPSKIDSRLRGNDNLTTCHPRESGDPSKIDSRLRGNDNLTTRHPRESGDLSKIDSRLSGNDNGLSPPEIDTHKEIDKKAQQEVSRQRQNKTVSARRKTKNQARALARQQKRIEFSVERDQTSDPTPSFPHTTPLVTQTVQKTSPTTITPRVTLSLPCPHVGFIALQPTEQKVLTMLNQANELAYTIGGSVRQRLAGSSVHANSDIDIVTSASGGDVFNLFKTQFDIEPTLSPNLFRIFSEYNLIEIWCSTILATTRCSQADAKKRDFVDNVYSADAKGNVWYLLPEKEALANASEIHTIVSADESLSEDPTRILRAVDHSTKTGKGFSKELSTAMEKHAKLLVQKEHCVKTNARMLHMFSQGNAAKNFSTLLEFKFFDTLFFPHANDLRKDTAWVINELNLFDHLSEPPTLHEIYALFIISILMQDDHRNEHSAKAIIAANNLFAKNFERYCNLNRLLLNTIARWEQFHPTSYQTPYL